MYFFFCDLVLVKILMLIKEILVGLRNGFGDVIVELFKNNFSEWEFENLNVFGGS